MSEEEAEQAADFLGVRMHQALKDRLGDGRAIEP